MCMRKFLLTWGILAVPFVAQAPTMFEPPAEEGKVVIEEKQPEPSLQINKNVEKEPEVDSYHVVKSWGRYKVVNVDDVLEVPEFFRRKSEAVEFANTMNRVQLISN